MEVTELVIELFTVGKKKVLGNVDMSDAIKHSYNTYFYTIANQIGNEKIAKIMRIYGQKLTIAYLVQNLVWFQMMNGCKNIF